MNDALNVHRSKNKGVLVEMIDNVTKDVVPYLLFGTVSIVFCALIYFGLPISILANNIGLILTIFFIILLGLLLGLVIMATNLQSAFEFLLMHILLFWETKAMKMILKKNMVNHKQKNQLTAIIYALTLGSVIFLLTSANLEV